MSLSRRTVPLHRNPALRPGLAKLAEWLLDSDFNAHAIDGIIRYVGANGTPTGCPHLPAEDEAAATAVFMDGLDLVPYSSAAWDHEDVYLDSAMLADGTHPFPLPEPPDGPDAPYDGPHARFPGVRALPRISGGSDEAEPFTPSQSDWDDYAEWSRELEARYAAAEARTPTAGEVRAWLDANEHTRPDVTI
jgi:hypothetical protein